MSRLGGAESRVGRLRLGAHPSPAASLFGADGARTSAAAAFVVAGRPPQPCSPVSGAWSNEVWVYLYNGQAGVGFPSPAGIPPQYKITGGAITQDIRNLPYAQGRVDIVIDDAADRVRYKSMVGLNLLQIQQSLRTWWGISGGTLGRFEIQTADGFFDADTGEEKLSFELVARASGSVGPTVEGDLPTIALPYASSLGLVADGRASIEGIAAYILSQYQGRAVIRGPGITPIPAFQSSTTYLGTTYYLGPYNLAHPMGAGQILALALYQSATYVNSDTSGAAILCGYPETSGGPAPAPPAWVFSTLDDCAWPIRSIKPSPTEAPETVTGINQSMLAVGSTHVVTTQYGVGSGKPYYFNNFRPTAAGDAAFQRRVRQLAYRHDQQATAILLTTPSHPAMRAGDICMIEAPEYGIPFPPGSPPSLFMMVSVTLPLSEDMNAQVYCEAL